MLIINQLVERIRQNPPGVESRRLLMAQYAACGWLADAERQARKILGFEPSDRAAKEFIKKLLEPSGAKESRQEQRMVEPKIDVHWKSGNVQSFQVRKSSSPKVNALSALANLVINSEDKKLGNATRGLSQEHRAYPTRPKPQMSVQALANVVSSTSRNSKTKALDLMCDDLKDLADLIRGSRSSKSQERKDEAVRQALLKRTRDVKFFLPGDLQQLTGRAFMHIEHEILHRNYVNMETMYGDPVSEIPRARFWVSEDGYAWDMDELAQAIDSNRGIMRNPLSKHMFTSDDVRAIVHHPLGERLKALEVNQRELRRGVRGKTAGMLSSLSKTLLRDDEETGFVPSRRAVEEFKAYVATLPAAEQRAIDMLWVPAVDHHTGMGFDMSIGEALEDALANRVCFHKVGDLLGQAARYLIRG